VAEFRIRRKCLRDLRAGPHHGAGQLAGGLAWLTISGEDAPDLVASAPVLASRLLLAKIEAVDGAIALVFCPFVIALGFISPLGAVVAALGIAAAAISATAIQLWFRSQAKRSQFRRRHTSSRIATYAEAFSSISWAATAQCRIGKLACGDHGAHRVRDRGGRPALCARRRG